MKFYQVPATDTAPAQLELTKDAARATAKARGLKFRDVDQVDVPTVKAGLAAYVNALLAARSTIAAEMPPRPPETAPAAPTPAAGFMTQGTVDALFTPQPQPGDRRDSWGSGLHSAAAADRRAGLPVDLGERVDAICDAIDDLGGHHLGNVAHAIAARFKRLAQQAKDLAA